MIEPESPGYLAFCSEPDFRRQDGRDRAKRFDCGFRVAQVVGPASLYLAGKPAWWGDCPWPAIGADVDVTAIANGGKLPLIPAEQRYQRLVSVVEAPAQGTAK